VSFGVVGLLVVVATAAVIVGTRHGPGATPDSATYASVAENLGAGRGLTTFDGSELTLFPPGLPIAVAAGRLIGLGPPDAARVVNALAMVATVVMAAALMRRTLARWRVQLVGVALVTIAPPLLLVSVMFWSDMPFVALTLGFLMALDAARRDGTHLAAAGAGVLAGVAFLFRYPGLVLVGFGMVTLALGALRSGSRRRTGVLATYAGIAVLPVAVWFSHNLANGALLSAVSGSPLEDRTASGIGLAANLWQAIQTVGSWLAPRGSVVALVIVVGVGAWLAGRSHPERAAAGSSSVALLMWFSVTYLAFIVLGASLTKVDVIDDRLLAPVVVPLLVVLLVSVESLLAKTSDRSRLVGAALIAALLVWTLYPAGTWLSRLETATDGVGFAAERWQESETVAALAVLSGGAPVYSNWPDAVYYVGGVQPVAFGPSDGAGVADLVDEARCTGGVWYAQLFYDRPTLMDPAELGPQLQLQVHDRENDGLVYRVLPASSSGGCQGQRAIASATVSPMAILRAG
jgi:Dolichyl-phosphate-mannose-protein mannosyltransferase